MHNWPSVQFESTNELQMVAIHIYLKDRKFNLISKTGPLLNVHHFQICTSVTVQCNSQTDYLDVHFKYNCHSNAELNFNSCIPYSTSSQNRMQSFIPKCVPLATVLWMRTFPTVPHRVNPQCLYVMVCDLYWSCSFSE